jgi:hypothetical protein
METEGELEDYDEKPQTSQQIKELILNHEPKAIPNKNSQSNLGSKPNNGLFKSILPQEFVSGKKPASQSGKKIGTNNAMSEMFPQLMQKSSIEEKQSRNFTLDQKTNGKGNLLISSFVEERKSEQKIIDSKINANGNLIMKSSIEEKNSPKVIVEPKNVEQKKSEQKIINPKINVNENLAMKSSIDEKNSPKVIIEPKINAKGNVIVSPPIEEKKIENKIIDPKNNAMQNLKSPADYIKPKNSEENSNALNRNAIEKNSKKEDVKASEIQSRAFPVNSMKNIKENEKPDSSKGKQVEEKPVFQHPSAVNEVEKSKSLDKLEPEFNWKPNNDGIPKIVSLSDKLLLFKDISKGIIIKYLDRVQNSIENVNNSDFPIKSKLSDILCPSCTFVAVSIELSCKHTTCVWCLKSKLSSFSQHPTKANFKSFHCEDCKKTINLNFLINLGLDLSDIDLRIFQDLKKECRRCGLALPLLSNFWGELDCLCMCSSCYADELFIGSGMCPICSDLLRNAEGSRERHSICEGCGVKGMTVDEGYRVTACGHELCFLCIQAAANSKNCPVCKKTMENKEIRRIAVMINKKCFACKKVCALGDMRRMNCCYELACIECVSRVCKWC